MKLDQNAVTRICTRVVDHDVATKIVAAQFDVTRRVQQLAKQYRDASDVPQLVTPGRNPYGDHPADLADHDIRHSFCTVGQPQSNGTVERFFQTDSKQRWRFDGVAAFLAVYNEKRPHTSLGRASLETSAEAFERLRPERQWISTKTSCWRQR